MEGLSHVPRCCCYFLTSIKNCNNQSHLHLSEWTTWEIQTQSTNTRWHRWLWGPYWSEISINNFIRMINLTLLHESHCRVINIENCRNCKQLSFLLLHITPMLGYEKLWMAPPESATNCNSLLSSIHKISNHKLCYIVKVQKIKYINQLEMTRGPSSVDLKLQESDP